MAKYSKYLRKTKPRKVMNPLWRGIGCLLMVIVPAISYWLANVILQEAKGMGFIPQELLGYLHFPDWAWEVPVLSTILPVFAGLRDVWAFLIFFAVIVLLISGLVSLLYSAGYQMVGPARYSELDSPPEKRKAKEYKR